MLLVSVDMVTSAQTVQAFKWVGVIFKTDCLHHNAWSSILTALLSRLASLKILRACQYVWLLHREVLDPVCKMERS